MQCWCRAIEIADEIASDVPNEIPNEIHIEIPNENVKNNVSMEMSKFPTKIKQFQLKWAHHAKMDLNKKLTTGRKTLQTSK